MDHGAADQGCMSCHLDVCRMSVPSDGRFVACADASGQVLLYGFLPHKGAYYKWDLVGKFKAHHSKRWTCVPCVVYEARQWMVALSLRNFKASCTCKHTRFLLATSDDSML